MNMDTFEIKLLNALINRDQQELEVLERIAHAREDLFAIWESHQALEHVLTEWKGPASEVDLTHKIMKQWKLNQLDQPRPVASQWAIQSSDAQNLPAHTTVSHHKKLRATQKAQSSKWIIVGIGSATLFMIAAGIWVTQIYSGSTSNDRMIAQHALPNSNNVNSENKTPSKPLKSLGEFHAEVQSESMVSVFCNVGLKSPQLLNYAIQETEESSPVIPRKLQQLLKSSEQKNNQP
jgi:hypothetical protein